MRVEHLEHMACEWFDILIIGGGITGTAAARDAALRGYTVALIEKEDFASGPSSRSSRLIPGGLLKAGNKVMGAQVRDVLANNAIEVKARAVVNAAGPWVDRVLGLDAAA